MGWKRIPAIGEILDDRYQAGAAENLRMAPARAVIALAMALLAGFAVGWPLALAWGSALMAAEGASLFLGKDLTHKRLSASRLVAHFAFGCLGVPVWGAFGLMLWTGPSEACRLAALVFWCGQLLYAQKFCVSSPLDIIQACVPCVLAPLLIPLLLPRFHGTDQVMVMVMLLLCVLHAIQSAVHNIRSKQALDAAARDLLAGKLTAEAARAQMAEAKAEAEAANQAKSTFLATMSHEIRTPLNGVLGMAQAMAAEDLPLAQRERLSVVQQSGETLLAILNDVLDLAKIEAGRLDLEEIEFDLTDAVRSAAATFESLAEAKGLSFALDIEAARGRYLGDPNRVRQILHNLVSNAVKFTEAGRIEVKAVPETSGLTLQVSDTGVGIGAEALARLFQPFAQGDASTTRRYGGTGLGLSICRQLAELMGGSITATSQPGRGSNFAAFLPLVRLGDECIQPAASPDADCAPARGLRVLAAEDNAVNQLVLKTLLAQAGVEPTVVEHGAQAVAAWEAGDWDLVLMDIQMPVMDGPTAARTIRRLEVETGRTRTPIVALTANVMAHQVADYAAAGMDGNVAKPIRAEELFAAIQAALDAGPGAAAVAAA